MRPPTRADGKPTPAYARIAETWNRAFRVDPKRRGALRNDLKQVFDLRGMAVHMSSGFGAPALHPHYHVAIDTKFLWFRYDNAAAVTQAARGLMSQMVRAPRDRYPALVGWIEAQSSLLGLEPPSSEDDDSGSSE